MGEKRLGLLTLIGSQGCQGVKVDRSEGLLERSDPDTEERGGFYQGRREEELKERWVWAKRN